MDDKGRRGFLKTLLGVVGAVIVKPFVPAPFNNVDALNKALTAGFSEGVGGTLHIHSLEATLKTVTFSKASILPWKGMQKLPAFDTLDGRFQNRVSAGLPRQKAEPMEIKLIDYDVDIRNATREQREEDIEERF